MPVRLGLALAAAAKHMSNRAKTEVTDFEATNQRVELVFSRVFVRYFGHSGPRYFANNNAMPGNIITNIKPIICNMIPGSGQKA